MLSIKKKESGYEKNKRWKTEWQFHLAGSSTVWSLKDEAWIVVSWVLIQHPSLTDCVTVLRQDRVLNKLQDLAEAEHNRLSKASYLP